MSDFDSKRRKLDDTTTKENNKTLKGIFRRDDFEDSSTSDWGLLDEDSYKFKKRNLSVKLDKEPLTLICEWNSCYEDFTDFSCFNKHIKQHLNDLDIKAELCSLECSWLECTYETNSMLDLIQHVSFHGYHTKLKSVGKNVESRNDLPECTQKSLFVIPIISGGYYCEWEYCDEQFNTAIDLFEHARVHVFHNPRSAKGGIIECCWKGCRHKGHFMCQYKLAEHLRMHTKEKIIACPSCGHLFANKTKFCDHRRRQLPSKMQSYLCSHCMKYFPSERLLRDHMRLHINHYKCSMCEMTCPKPSILAKHIRYRHLNEKPYKCTQCDYRCVSKHNLDFHVKKHNLDSAFECSECEYKCRSAYGIQRHNQTNHGKGCKDVYECHICKKCFNRGGLLTKHLMKTHNFHWPSGHSRFRYRKDQDDVHRLQTVRYETLDVTKEIIKGKTQKAPPANENRKYNVLRRFQNGNSIDKFDIIPTNDPVEVETLSKVEITINDLDSKGNLVKSETIQSDEVVRVTRNMRKTRSMTKKLAAST